MKKSRRFIIGGIIILVALSYLITGSMREAMVYFKTPSELMANEGRLEGQGPADRGHGLGWIFREGS